MISKYLLIMVILLTTGVMVVTGISIQYFYGMLAGYAAGFDYTVGRRAYVCWLIYVSVLHLQ